MLIVLASGLLIALLLAVALGSLVARLIGVHTAMKRVGPLAEVPNSWGESEFTKYIDHARLNQFRTFATWRPDSRGIEAVVNENHLMKVVHQLGVAGLIDTVRGRNGGLRLRKPPAAIGHVIRLMEPDIDIVPCFNDSSGCVIEPACLLKSALAEAWDAFLAALDCYTLADIAKPRRRLSTLFPVESGHA